MTQAKRTPLYDRHVAAGATMVGFAGYDMPQQYTSIRDEHVAVRERAGLFDVSHMGEVLLSGSGAAETVQRLVTNDVSRLVDGQALYSMMCNEQGGIVDDVIVYRNFADVYKIVINAACREKDVAWIRDHLGPKTTMLDFSDDVALLAVQGPRAVDIVATLAGVGVRDLEAFHSMEVHIADSKIGMSRTGYSGEDGFELYVDAADSPRVWDALCDAGKAVDLRCCGLGARDTLRLEAGLRLYGQDMDETTDPYSCGLGWTVKRDVCDFIGASALRVIDSKNPPRRFVGITAGGRVIPRHGQEIFAHDRVAGVITSGGFSFTLGFGVAMASLNADVETTAPLTIDIRGSRIKVQRAPLPFYRRPAPVGGSARA